jgi:hypothetical protein
MEVSHFTIRTLKQMQSLWIAKISLDTSKRC